MDLKEVATELSSEKSENKTVQPKATDQTKTSALLNVVDRVRMIWAGTCERALISMM